jgi:hypothetical protein
VIPSDDSAPGRFVLTVIDVLVGALGDEFDERPVEFGRCLSERELAPRSLFDDFDRRIGQFHPEVLRAVGTDLGQRQHRLPVCGYPLD